MTLGDYGRLLLRRGWIIVLAIALTAGAAYVFSRLQTRIYRATQEVALNPARNDLGLQQTMEQRMASYAAYIDTNRRAAIVIDTLKLDMTPEQLAGNVTVTPDLNTLRLNIDVDMTDGELAKQISTAYAQVFLQWLTETNEPLRIEDRVYGELNDDAKYGLFRPNTTINVAAGALLGVILGGLIVFALEFAEAGIVNARRDVERAGLNLMAALPGVE